VQDLNLHGRIAAFATRKISIVIVAGPTETDTIRKHVEEHPDFLLIPARGSGLRLLGQMDRLRPDMVIVDIELPAFDWISGVHELNTTECRPGIVLLTGDVDNADLLSAFREGADAYLPKNAIQTELIPALSTVSRGRIYLSKADAELIREHMLYLELGKARNVSAVHNGIAGLSLREKELFPLLADGLSIKESAGILGISPKTVETHKSHIMKKLNVTRVTDLTKLAIKKDLIPF
jgi:two-component system, NarL family, response regulator NreC